MAKYRKKPIVIEAFQWEPNMGEGGGVVLRRPNPSNLEREHFYAVMTLEGPLRVSPGDFIITGVEDERYPCKPDIFEATYEPEEGREALNEGYAEQLEEVKDILIRESVVTAEEVGRDGLRFALKRRFEPAPARAEKFR